MVIGGNRELILNLHFLHWFNVVLDCYILSSKLPLFTLAIQIVIIHVHANIVVPTKVRVRILDRQKRSPPSPRAGAGQENIETVHEPKPIQTPSSP
jgi:hypothetical protein